MTSTENVANFVVRLDVYTTPDKLEFGNWDQAVQHIMKLGLIKPVPPSEFQVRHNDEAKKHITHRVDTATVYDLLYALNVYCRGVKYFDKTAEKERRLSDMFEYNFTISPRLTRQTRIPEKFLHLIAYTVEGGSEGHYVHVGAQIRNEADPKSDMCFYLDFGFAKILAGADVAYAAGREAQRFLTACEWN